MEGFWGAYVFLRCMKCWAKHQEQDAESAGSKTGKGQWASKVQMHRPVLHLQNKLCRCRGTFSFLFMSWSLCMGKLYQVSKELKKFWGTGKPSCKIQI